MDCHPDVMALENPSGAGDSPIRRAEHLWFKDCGLVIRAGNVVFRVSGEILAAKSPVFRDMLQIPQPLDGETVDGCPVVCLPDDPLDTTAFLRAIFDSECVFCQNNLATRSFVTGKPGFLSRIQQIQISIQSTVY
jgi:hypothetical protein